MFNLIDYLIAVVGLITGYVITHFSYDECKDKSSVFKHLLLLCAIMLSLTSIPYSLFFLALLAVYYFFYGNSYLLVISSLVSSLFLLSSLSILFLFINSHLIGSVYYLRRHVA